MPPHLKVNQLTWGRGHMRPSTGLMPLYSTQHSPSPALHQAQLADTAVGCTDVPGGCPAHLGGTSGKKN